MKFPSRSLLTQTFIVNKPRTLPLYPPLHRKFSITRPSHKDFDSGKVEEYLNREPPYPYPEIHSDALLMDNNYDPYEEYMPGADTAEGYYPEGETPEWLEEMETRPPSEKFEFRTIDPPPEGINEDNVNLID